MPYAGWCQVSRFGACWLHAAAKKIGDIPRQTRDNAAAGVNDTLKQGTGQLKEDDKKQ
ncbi:MAG: hypothetical protein WA373_07885 [Burkholderiales bacterium]